MSPHRFFWLGFLSALALGTALSSGWAQAPPDEYDHKSRFVYHFCHFVDWPKTLKPLGGKFVIGVLGKDPFEKHLDRFDGAEVDGKKIEIRRFKTVEKYEQCHLLYVASEGDLLAALPKTKDTPVLLVSDKSGLARKGSMINMFLDKENKVRFEINHDAAKRVGLNIRANLLKLAEIVKDSEESP